nr:phosphatase [Cronobacter sakazakii]
CPGIAANPPADTPRLDEAALVIKSLTELVLEKGADGWVSVKKQP